MATTGNPPDHIMAIGHFNLPFNQPQHRRSSPDEKTVSLAKIKALEIEIEKLQAELKNIMIVCSTCKKEMQCTQMGVGVRYGPDAKHRYAGDRYICKGCNKEIVWTVGTAHPDEHFKKDDIYMTVPYHAVVERTTNLRQMEEDNNGHVLLQPKSGGTVTKTVV